MRVRITKSLTGSIDGIQLSRLSQGHVYDVNTSLGCYLLSEEMAEPAPNESPTAILPVEEQLFRKAPTVSTTGVVLPKSTAADRVKRRREDPESK
jgi:hypothetical protein